MPARRKSRRARRGTPRTANNLLRWVRDFAQVKADGKITAELADRALTMLEIDRDGFDQWDKRIIEALIHKFNGGPVGLNSLAVAIGEEAGTLEEVNEPYLIMEGYIKRTAARPRRAAECLSQTRIETAGRSAERIVRFASAMSDFFQQTAKIFTVAELTRAHSRHARNEIRRGLGAGRNFQLQAASVRPPIFHAQRSARADRLRDFSQHVFRRPKPLSDGAQVQVYGQISVFEARGQYQLNVQILQPRGLGVLQAKFEALKRKLEAEGLFDAARKRPLPKFPRRIGIVTSRERRGHSRYSECVAAARAGAADSDQSRARAGRGRGHGNRRSPFAN